MEWRFIRRPLVRAGYKNIAVSYLGYMEFEVSGAVEVGGAMRESWAGASVHHSKRRGPY